MMNSLRLGKVAVFSYFAWAAAHAGCSGSAPSVSARSVSAPSEWPELYRGALTDYVPAAGLRWLVVIDPAHWALHPALKPIRESWLTSARLEKFAAVTAIDLTRTRHALVAGFDLGTLYMTDASGWIDAPDARFAERLAGSATVHRPHPDVWRITGLVGSMPQAMVRVDGELVAVAVGDLTSARVVELRARGRLANVTMALAGAALAGLPPDFAAPGPLQFFALGPFEGEWLNEGRGLLAGARAVAANFAVDADKMHFRLALTGYWNPARDGEHLLALWRAVAASSVGQLMSLDRASSTLRVDASDALLALDGELDLTSLLEGMKTLAVGDLERLWNNPDTL